ncbi:MAG: PaaX family transcriptional regulator [Rhodopseudomonas palustris]|nr:MAG: PaaX family transcriptional regulator [Rhodopseudomonas palustris]
MTDLAQPSPRHLLMNLLRAADKGCLTAAEAVAAGELFGISGNATRVALARLAAAGLVDAKTRGSYRLGQAGVALDNEVSAWRSAEARVVPWSGRWIAVLTTGLPRTDRAAWRARERALSLLGLRELQGALFVRPDNLDGGVASVRARLASLGVGAETPVFCADQFDDALDQQARQLWNVDELMRSYRDGCARLTQWLAGAASLPEGIAAKEAFLIGDHAIRQLVFDPLLPDPLIDAALRRRYRDTVIAFDQQGRAIWSTFLAAARARTTVSAA